MKLTIILARRIVPPSFTIRIGSTIGFETAVDDPVEVHFEGHFIARGEVRVKDDQYGLRITERLEATHPSLTTGTLEVILAECPADEALLGKIAPEFVMELGTSQHDVVEVRRDGTPVARGYIKALGDRVGVKVTELIVSG